MREISCSGVLFDLDGVLVDSTPAVARVWTIWAQKHGFDPEETVRQAHGRPSLSTVRELLPNANHEEENRVLERMEIEDLEGVVPLPGAMELLKALPVERWAIVTSCTRALARVRIRAAGLLAPKYLVTANDIQHGKPNPEPYLKGAALLGLRPAECLVVEDAPAGIRAGKAAGARVLAVQTTERDELLNGAGADWIVRDCSTVTMDGLGKGNSLVLRMNFS
ncbi:MAG TPA: HAD family hydrolase [Candidatus Acidoferrum sp.]|nr:HAD family hydrolase [Candidatus Acidoferrum sp.]